MNLSRFSRIFLSAIAFLLWISTECFAEVVIKTDTVVCETGTLDILKWKGKEYTMSISPVFIFDKLQKMYEYEVEIEPRYIYYSAAASYLVDWVLVNDSLFAKEISLTHLSKKTTEKIYPNNKVYRLFEELTGRKFIDLKNPDYPHGLLFADWFSGIINAQIVFLPFSNKNQYIDFFRLAFEKGKLISATHFVIENRYSDK